MSHEELRSLLAPYAAATLVAPAADAVRAHLATGCPICLNDFYHLPVGLPRGPEPAIDGRPTPPAPTPAVTRTLPPVAPAGPPRAARARTRGRLLALGLGLALGLTLVWAMRQLRGREAAERERGAELAARATAAEARRAELSARLEAAERDLAAARAATARQPETVGAAAARRVEELERDLEAARARIATLARRIQRRDADIDRLEAAADEGRVLRELLGIPGAQLLRLEPLPPFRAPRGHVLWNPARSVLMLYAFRLPQLPDGISYRLRLVIEGEGGAAQPLLRPRRAGEIALPVWLDGTAARLRQVEILRDPPGEPVLVGRPAPPAG